MNLKKSSRDLQAASLMAFIEGAAGPRAPREPRMPRLMEMPQARTGRTPTEKAAEARREVKRQKALCAAGRCGLLAVLVAALVLFENPPAPCEYPYPVWAGPQACMPLPVPNGSTTTR